MRKYASLRRKLTAMISGGGIAAALIAAAGFSWLDLNRCWRHVNAEVSAVANVIASQVGPAIRRGDYKSAGEILGSVRSDVPIRDAVLYDDSVYAGPIASRRKSRAFGFVACHRLTSSGLSWVSTRIVPSACIFHENRGNCELFKMAL